ncbi:MAG: vanillate O-demethylase oxidoreductase VanB [Acidobacteria bacterium]|nr:vanillate O-demethylase oxidoreductase VanB [Acidobacteriota bacterium]
MTIAELSRIDRTVEIQATPERIWRALTRAEELSAWFQVKIEGTIAPGCEAWMTSVHDSCAGERFRVLFVEMTPPVRFVWQWHPGAVDPTVDYSNEPRTTVTFTLTPSGTGTLLRVVETGFDEVSLARRAKVYRDNDQGWAEVVEWLQQYAEKER